MIRDNYRAICEGKEIRANLIALKEELKDEKNVRAFAYMLGGDFSVLGALLKHEDPKVRKNAALLLGKMESEDMLPVLYEAYLTEKTRFVKADYLKAISQMDYEPLTDQLEQRLVQLRNVDAAPEEKKHLAEEIRVLQAMVLKYRKAGNHRFNGFHRKENVILVTNREQSAATAAKIPAGKVTRLKGGLRVHDVELGDLLPIRTWTEMLFPIQTDVLRADDPEEIGRRLGTNEAVGTEAEELKSSVEHSDDSLTGRMVRLHGGKAPFRFRIELKSKMETAKKGAYIRKISDALERASHGVWINSTTDYEAEIRLLERKDGTFQPMLKLFTIQDSRFSYRREFIASSISPVNAALTAELARPYLKEDAQILDPFCGVGTMLIERAKAVPAGTMYGLDIYGEAIDKARTNTMLAGCRVNYINRDFFTFEHEYLFDEIITDLPQVTQAKPKPEIHQLYLQFFDKAQEHLKENGVMVLYVTEPQFAAEAVRRNPRYRVEASYLLNEKNKTTVYIVRMIR